MTPFWKTQLHGLWLPALLGLACHSSTSRVISGSGTFEAIEVQVAAEVAGRVVSMGIEEGDRVRPGDLLAQLDRQTYELRVREARATLLRARSNYELLRRGFREEDIRTAEEQLHERLAVLENARREEARVEALVKANLAPQDQLDNAHTAVEVARRQYEQARAQWEKAHKGPRFEEIEAARGEHEAAQAQLALAEEDLARTTITGPVAGTITDRLVERGEYVARGTPVATIAQLDTLHLTLYLPETQVGRVKLGDSAAVRMDAFPEQTFPARVIFISPEAEYTPKTVQTKEERVKLVFAVKLAVSNPEGYLKAGLPAEAEIEVGPPTPR